MNRILGWINFFDIHLIDWTIWKISDSIWASKPPHVFCGNFNLLKEYFLKMMHVNGKFLELLRRNFDGWLCNHRVDPPETALVLPLAGHWGLPQGPVRLRRLEGTVRIKK